MDIVNIDIDKNIDRVRSADDLGSIGTTDASNNYYYWPTKSNKYILKKEVQTFNAQVQVNL